MKTQLPLIERYNKENLPRAYLAGKMHRKPWHGLYNRDWYDNTAWEPVVIHPRNAWPQLSAYPSYPFLWIGPFQMGCDHGCSHSATVFHKAQTCSEDESLGQETIVERCFSTIDTADIVCAHIESTDAFGTFVEVGYALAKGKRVSLTIDTDLVHRLQRADYYPVDRMFEEAYHYDHDLWFIMRAVERAKNTIAAVAKADMAMKFHVSAIHTSPITETEMSSLAAKLKATISTSQEHASI